MTATMRLIRYLGAAALACALAMPAAFAADPDEGSPPEKPVCAKGNLYSDKDKKCIPITAGVLPDDELIEQARRLAVSGHYEEALAILGAVQQKDNAKALTYMGYSYRKMGKTQEGIDYYKRALAIDPKNANTHEYLGEGYLQSGHPELAREELAKVEAICGKQCEQYRDLAGKLPAEGK